MFFFQVFLFKFPHDPETPPPLVNSGGAVSRARLLSHHHFQPALLKSDRLGFDGFETFDMGGFGAYIGLPPF